MSADRAPLDMGSGFVTGTTVRIVGPYRTGETGTVVHVPSSVLADFDLTPPADTIPVALMSVSGLPLWFYPDELERVNP